MGRSKKKHDDGGEEGDEAPATDAVAAPGPSAGMMGMPGFPPMMGMPMMGGMGGGMPSGMPAAAPQEPKNANIPAAFRKKAAEAAPAAQSQTAAPAPGGMPMPKMGGMPGMPAGMPPMDPSMMAMMMSMMGGPGGFPPMGDPLAGAPMPDMAAMMSTMSAMPGMSSMPGMSGMPGMPGMAPAPKPQPKKKEVEEDDDPDRARTSTELAKDPDIVELFDHFQIDTRHLERFCRSMEKRDLTFEGDMLKIWELCEQARSPEGMLVSKIKEMEDGIFVGKTIPDEALMNMSKKYKLDKPAESKLSDVLAKYDKERRREYLEEIDAHLATSARPSAMVMMFLKKLGTGQSLGKPGRVAPGSFAAKQEEDKRRGGGKGGGKGGDRDRDRNRSRSRSRDRDRDRDRGRRDDDRGRRDERGGSDRYNRDRD